jgi:hypothetical protein
MPATAGNVIDFIWESGVRVNRFWVKPFVGRHIATFSLRQATFLEEDRHSTHR